MYSLTLQAVISKKWAWNRKQNSAALEIPGRSFSNVAAWQPTKSTPLKFVCPVKHVRCASVCWGPRSFKTESIPDHICLVMSSIFSLLCEIWCHNSVPCPVLQSREMWGQLGFPKCNIHHSDSQRAEEHSKAGLWPKWAGSSFTHTSGELCHRLFDLTIDWALY